MNGAGPMRPMAGFQTIKGPADAGPWPSYRSLASDRPTSLLQNALRGDDRHALASLSRDLAATQLADVLTVVFVLGGLRRRRTHDRGVLRLRHLEVDADRRTLLAVQCHRSVDRIAVSDT